MGLKNTRLTDRWAKLKFLKSRAKPISEPLLSVSKSRIQDDINT